MQLLVVLWVVNIIILFMNLNYELQSVIASQFYTK